MREEKGRGEKEKESEKKRWRKGGGGKKRRGGGGGGADMPTNLMGHFENHVCTGDPDTRRSPSTQLSKEEGG